METRDEHGLWKKGVSGNPNGRPKQLSEIKALARVHSPAALARLVANLDHENGSIANQAAIAILDRAHGKPAQAIVGGDDDESPLRMIVECIIVENDTSSDQSGSDVPSVT